MAQQDRARLTRDRIILGAAVTFCRVGYQAATIDDIATEAAVTKGAIYFHFTSKEHVVSASVNS